MISQFPLNRFRNAQKNYIYLCQYLNENFVVEPCNFSAWHKADANRSTAVHLHCQGSSWSLGTVDINNIGTSLLLLPSEKPNNV